MSNNSTNAGDRGALGAASRPPQVVDLPDPPKPRKGNILLRSLGLDPGRLGFEHLGMGDRTRSILSDALARPQGFVLAAGPPGSGRTTTIYATVEHIRASRAIMPTFDEPAGELFVPEIRDGATAELAIDGARVGCLVLSTIRADDVTSAIQRMISLGISPLFLAATVRAIIAQRLVRIVCDGCREETRVRKALFDSRLPRTQWRGNGCALCGGSGYRGCTGIFELLVINDTVRQELAKHTGEPAQPLLDLASTGLYEDGLRLVRAGVTTVEEVFRVTSVECYPRLYTRT